MFAIHDGAVSGEPEPILSSHIFPCTDRASRLEAIVRLLVVCERAALVTCLIISILLDA